MWIVCLKDVSHEMSSFLQQITFLNAVYYSWDRCFNHSNCRLLVILKVIFANSVDPDQTAPAVWLGSTLFACMQK